MFVGVMPSLLRALLFVRAFSCLSNKRRFDAYYRFKLIYSVILLHLLLVQMVNLMGLCLCSVYLMIQRDMLIRVVGNEMDHLPFIWNRGTPIFLSFWEYTWLADYFE